MALNEPGAVSPVRGSGRPRNTTTSVPFPLPSALYAVGLVLVFLGERLIGTGRASHATTVAGLLLVLLAFGTQAARLGRRPAAERGPEKSLIALYGLGLLALGAYFLTSNVWFQLTGATLEKQSPRLHAILSTLWPALMLISILPVLFVELSLATMARAPVRDVFRVRAAMFAGLGIGFALVFCFSFAYVSSERDKKVDLSYFRVARAGESTLKLARHLDKPVEVFLFFPPANDVLVEIESYFEDLKKQSPHIKVEIIDHAVNPARAKELGVSGNGIIVVGRDKLREQIAMPLQVERARDQLKRLDEEVHKRLLGVTRPARVAYLTQGHGERGSSGSDDTDRRATIRLMREFLLDQGYEVKDLGMAEGLASQVPNDATMVMVIGPTRDFLAEEIASLGSYVERQGRLLIALDPEPTLAFDNLLAPFGLKFRPQTLNHDEIYWRRAHTAADRVNIVVGNFSSHASVTTLSRFGKRAPVILPGAGYLEKAADNGSGLTNVRFTVTADSKTWADGDNNHEFDSGNEVRRGYEVAAVVSQRSASAVLPEEEGRVLVLADSDGICDGVIQNQGNGALFIDAVRWLGGEERISGRINTEEDVPITHTRKQDVAWFYGTVFMAPVFILGIGFFVTRKRRHQRKAALAPPAAPPPSPPETPAAPEAAAAPKGDAP